MNKGKEEKKKDKKKEKNENIEIKLNINKKQLLKGCGIVAGVILVIVLAFFASKSYGSGTPAYEFTNITIDEYLEKMNSEEKSIIYIARPSCSYCQLETPILKQLASRYDLEVFYLNTENFFDAEKQDYTEEGYKLINSSEEYSQGFGTPNTIIVQNGSIIDGVFQYVEAAELKELFEENGFINE